MIFQHNIYSDSNFIVSMFMTKNFSHLYRDVDFENVTFPIRGFKTREAPHEISTGSTSQSCVGFYMGPLSLNIFDIYNSIVRLNRTDVKLETIKRRCVRLPVFT